MEMMKVFDCQDMPHDVQELFFNWAEKGNDVYIDLHVHDAWKPIELVDPDACSYKELLKLDPDTKEEILKEEVRSGVKYVLQRGDYPLHDWLYDNGANIGEKVIVRHWW